MKKIALSLILTAAMLATMMPFGAIAADSAEAVPYSDVYDIDFNSGVVSTGTKSPSADTMLAWVSGEGYTRGFSVANSVDGSSWSLVDNVPGKEAGDLALKVISTPSSNATDNYMSITTKGFNAAYPYHTSVNCGANGYVVFSFDFYSDFLTPVIMKVGRYNCVTESNSTLTEVNKQNYIDIDKNGVLKMFGTQVTTLDPAVYTNKWTNIKTVFTGWNTYRLYIDGEPVNGFRPIVYNDEANLFRNIQELRLYDIHVAGCTSTKYYDNFRYSVMKVSDTEVSHSDANVDKYISMADTAIYTKPDMTASELKAGLSSKYYGLDGTVKIVDSTGTEAADDAVLSQAAALKLTTDLGVNENFDIVTEVRTVEYPTEDIVINEDYSIGGNWTYYKNYYTGRGYKPEKVIGIGGKAEDDEALKIGLETYIEATEESTESSASRSYLDFYIPDDATTAYNEANAPVTLFYSLYTHHEGDAGNDLTGRFGNTNGTNYAGNSVYLRDGWNRFALQLYPNSTEYNFYMNGVKASSGNLSTTLDNVDSKRFRFVLDSDTPGTYYALDDVAATFGIYDPEFELSFTNAQGTAEVYAEAVSNNGLTADLMNGLLVIAEYAYDGKLVNIELASGTPSMTASLECSLTNVEDMTKVKAFFWNKNTLYPYQSKNTLD
ncbi:MAG: hypothetical protein IJ460_07875 [Clostridia bacterium]|nr:hypothetical protein [Clostridia bacterium]